MYETYGMKPKWKFIKNVSNSKEKPEKTQSSSSNKRSLPPLPDKKVQINNKSKPPTSKTSDHNPWGSTASTYQSNIWSKEKQQPKSLPKSLEWEAW